MRQVQFSLPYPVGLSVNHYWHWTPKGVFLSKGAKQYRQVVGLLTRGIYLQDAKLSINIKLYHPTKRLMDIDNCLKVLLDSLQHAEVYNNDNQINKLCIERCGIIKGGRLDIEIACID